MWFEVRCGVFGLLVCVRCFFVCVWFWFVFFVVCRFFLFYFGFGVFLVLEIKGQIAILYQGRYEHYAKIKSCLNPCHHLDSFCTGINWRSVLEMLTRITTMFYGATPTTL